MTDLGTTAGARAQPSRRAVLLGAGLGALGLSGVLQAAHAALAVLPPVEAAASPPGDAVRATMSAFADTVVPGPAGGASRTPGAVEAGAVRELYDPFYGIADSFGLLHADLQLHTPLVLGRPAEFSLELPYADRERVLENRMVELPDGGENPYATLYQAVAVLVYLTYYGVAQSPVGLHTIGFPPASDGYFPGHSSGVRFAGMTSDGNPR